MSHRRLLRQPTAYEVLVIIWASPDFVPGMDWDDWASSNTAYGIALRLADDRANLSKTVNYVSRVVDAARFNGLIERTAVSGNRYILTRTSLLDDLMLHFATQALRSQAEGRAHHA